MNRIFECFIFCRNLNNTSWFRVILQQISFQACRLRIAGITWLKMGNLRGELNPRMILTFYPHNTPITQNVRKMIQQHARIISYLIDCRFSIRDKILHRYVYRFFGCLRGKKPLHISPVQ